MFIYQIQNLDEYKRVLEVNQKAVFWVKLNLSYLELDKGVNCISMRPVSLCASACVMSVW